MRLFAWSILALACLSACGASHDLDPMPDAATVDAAPALDAGTPPTDAAVIPDAFTATDAPLEVDAGPWEGEPSCAPDGGAPPSFRDLYEDVIAANGCASECHGGGSWATALDMSSAGIAYRSLVNVPSFCPDRVRVVPCHPEESTLSVVPSLREEPCGRRHTFGGGQVTDEQAVQIDDWIRLGAAW
jgi:hypothetical protein